MGWPQALGPSSDKACACEGAGASNAQQMQIDATVKCGLNMGISRLRRIGNTEVARRPPKVQSAGSIPRFLHSPSSCPRPPVEAAQPEGGRSHLPVPGRRRLLDAFAQGVQLLLRDAVNLGGDLHHRHGEQLRGKTQLSSLARLICCCSERAIDFS